MSIEKHLRQRLAREKEREELFSCAQVRRVPAHFSARQMMHGSKI